MQMNILTPNELINKIQRGECTNFKTMFEGQKNISTAKQLLKFVISIINYHTMCMYQDIVFIHPDFNLQDFSHIIQQITGSGLQLLELYERKCVSQTSKIMFLQKDPNWTLIQRARQSFETPESLLLFNQSFIPNNSLIQFVSQFLLNKYNNNKVFSYEQLYLYVQEKASKLNKQQVIYQNKNVVSKNVLISIINELDNMQPYQKFIANYFTWLYPSSASVQIALFERNQIQGIKAGVFNVLLIENASECIDTIKMSDLSKILRVIKYNIQHDNNNFVANSFVYVNIDSQPFQLKLFSFLYFIILTHNNKITGVFNQQQINAALAELKQQKLIKNDEYKLSQIAKFIKTQKTASIHKVVEEFGKESKELIQNLVQNNYCDVESDVITWTG
ncbi:Hypothetical_protein [Hexamita inflata]|uniref:Hypothetical_protein n=1 Tax=Hexamita inflata TaxID=28002 RepID=A0AA86R5L8_9EUKA|nr:Hypothetical protein HINF_LOCUS44221 [Hexamita inflata]CAI9966603.1 Hypothetical protein HINF_LOCUS54248 [Hexamita inflata]